MHANASNIAVPFIATPRFGSPLIVSDDTPPARDLLPWAKVSISFNTRICSNALFGKVPAYTIFVQYCETKGKLLEAAQDTFSRLLDLIEHQREAVRNEAQNTVAAIDIEIERVFGEKERTLGALYQHTKEHGC
ncbi:MAG TPA: hypothetical protein VH640_01495 [Bryobacteraceae bacterium]